jgi:hypothetical protein
MPTNRTPIHRRAVRQITPEAIAAWKRADYMALHIALDLRPWQASPLPYEITALGVDQDDTPENCGSAWDPSMPKAIALQKQLLELAGWPDCRAEYEKLLHQAEEYAAYCRELVEHPDRGGQGTGSDPKSRRQALANALERVENRKELLEGLEAVQSPDGHEVL